MVKYSTGFTAERAFLWQRRDFGEWSHVSDIGSPTGDPDSEGTFGVTLQLGEVYEVVLFTALRSTRTTSTSLPGPADNGRRPQEGSGGRELDWCT